MRSIYEIELLCGSIGVTITLSSQVAGFLAKWFNAECVYAKGASRMYGVSESTLIPFGGERFGYDGVFEYRDGKITLCYEQDKPLYYFAASLFLLFKCLNGSSIEQEGDNTPIEPMEIGSEGGTGLKAACSSDFHLWLGKRYGYGTRSVLPEARDAMLEAVKVLRPGERSLALIRGEMNEAGGFALYCDSNCCCMGARGKEGERLDLSTHNCDTVQNQMVFLVGLAALSGLYLDETGKQV